MQLPVWKRDRVLVSTTGFPRSGKDAAYRLLIEWSLVRIRPGEPAAHFFLSAAVPKSRAGCHFAAAIGLRSLLEDYAPTIPDWANDQHTLAGKKLGRGLDHFRKEGAKLIPPPTEPDPYEAEAYRLWQIKQQGK